MAAAVDAQARLVSELPWLAVRMAVHTGEAQLRGEGNYVGRTIIRCARLRACGHGGQILVAHANARAAAVDRRGRRVRPTRTRRRGRPATGWESLTPTERAVVDLVVRGATNAAIAGKLVMSPATVKTRLTQVFTKLDVTNRAQLAALATRNSG